MKSYDMVERQTSLLLEEVLRVDGESKMVVSITLVMIRQDRPRNDSVWGRKDCHYLALSSGQNRVWF